MDTANPLQTAIYCKERERAIALVLEGLRFDGLVRWKREELMEKQWSGFYVPVLNQPPDLNRDGALDVSFYTSISANSHRLSEGIYGELTWPGNIPGN